MINRSLVIGLIIGIMIGAGAFYVGYVNDFFRGEAVSTAEEGGVVDYETCYAKTGVFIGGSPRVCYYENVPFPEDTGETFGGGHLQIPELGTVTVDASNLDLLEQLDLAGDRDHENDFANDDSVLYQEVVFNDVVQFQIGPEKINCGNDTPDLCIEVNGSPFPYLIEGFSFEDGNRYVIDVSRHISDTNTSEDLDDLDEGEYSYELIGVVSQEVASTTP